MRADSFNIPKTVVLRILKEDLGKRKLCACVVPQSLTPEQSEERVTPYQDIIAKGDADKNLVKLLRETRHGVLPVTPKQSNRFMNGLASLPLSQRKCNSKGPTSKPCR